MSKKQRMRREALSAIIRLAENSLDMSAVAGWMDCDDPDALREAMQKIVDELKRKLDRSGKK